MARALPEQRLGELAAADPEEAGHLDVELARCIRRRRRDRRRPPDDACDPGGWSPTCLDEHRHGRKIAADDQRGVFVR
jgi:hypothetical protein